jgi:uncharacterized protein (TIGR03437 family)
VPVNYVGATTNAANAFRGYVGEPDSNSVTFYGVSVLPPVYGGYGRIFRITSLRVPTVGMTAGQQILSTISVTNTTALPLASTVGIAGVAGNPMTAIVDPAPSGGQHPFSQCAAPQSPALTAKLSFTEGFVSMFRTRVVPLSDTAWASTTPNTGTPGQNMPGGLYSGVANNSQSGFILPASTATVNSVTYTAGLADFGTRLKAVFTNIPSGITLYVSTSNASGYAIPGGQSTVPYAVLVANSQSNEAKDDGTALTPLTAGAVTGSDGLTAYPLTPDSSGTTAAIWEVVNANQTALDTLTFGVYATYNGTPSITGQTGQPVNNVALSFAPEPGGGTFTLASANTPEPSPVPRYSIVTPEQGSWISIAACTVDVTGSSPVAFSYTAGGTAPASQTVTVTTSPSTLPVPATPVVTTPDHGAWLGASLSGGTLTLSVDPAGLAASATAYTGNVKLSAAGVTDVLVPVTLTVYPAAALTIGKTHTGNFTQGQTGASYSITVANGASASATSKKVTVTESVPSGMTLVSMAGIGWDCTTLPSCTRSDSLAAGSVYPAIAVTVNVASNAAANLTNSATLSGEVSPGGDTANDTATIVQLPDLTIAKSHSGNFTQGQTGAHYAITVTNGGTGPVAGSNTVTVVDTLPSGLTATAISGVNWNCTLATLTCTRADALAAGASYPAITVTVNVAANAAASVTGSATVSGGGEINTANDTASDPTTVTQLPDLTIAKSHAGNFTQGQTGAQYVIAVTNSGIGPVVAGNTVTVVDALPTGLTATAIAGTNWNCALATLTCTRADALAVSASYPAITVTVNVAATAPSSVTNRATVSGGGESNTANDAASDAATITQLPDLAIAKSHAGNFTQGQMGAQYAITVTNSGNAAVVAGNTVTVVEALPTGLTATAIAGTNGNCTLATLTCTRADALAVSASYPAIAVTVNVAATAASSVTNTATVSGGGEINTANDTAGDITSIQQFVNIVVGTSPAGLSFTVDGVTYTSAHTFQWVAGSAHDIGTTTPQSISDQPFKFSTWPDSTAIVHTIAPNTAAIYTATFAAISRSGQTINFPPIPDKTFGDPPFSVSATASSGLPVSFSIDSGPATISGNIVSPKGAGTVTVVASQAGNAMFAPAVAVLGSFRVLSPNFTLSLAASPSAGGTIAATPSGGVYASGATVQVTAQPNSGFIFTGFSGDLSGTTNPQPVAMSQNRSVTANFAALSTGSADQLTFGVQTGSALPGSIAIPLDLGSSTAAVAVVPGTGGNWLSATLTPIANPTAVQLSLNASVADGLTSGTYLSYVVITTASGQRVVTVKLLIDSIGVSRVTDSAGYQARDLASDEWLTIFGVNEATQTAQATSTPGQTSLAGTSVTITDSAGVTRSALLSYVSPAQINLLTPSGMATGAGVLTVVNGWNQQATVNVTLGAVSPGLFSADWTGEGVAAAVILHVAADYTTSTSLAANCGSSSTCAAIPIDAGNSAGQVYLSLYGTGIRGRSSLSQVTVTVGGVPVQVQYAGAQSQYPGLDQINVLLPCGFRGMAISVPN